MTLLRRGYTVQNLAVNGFIKIHDSNSIKTQSVSEELRFAGDERAGPQKGFKSSRPSNLKSSEQE